MLPPRAATPPSRRHASVPPARPMPALCPHRHARSPPVRLRRAAERRGGGVAEGKGRGGGDSAAVEEGGGDLAAVEEGEREDERRLEVFWFIYFLKKG
jgi:hypothetical protein